MKIVEIFTGPLVYKLCIGQIGSKSLVKSTEPKLHIFSTEWGSDPEYYLSLCISPLANVFGNAGKVWTWVFVCQLFKAAIFFKCSHLMSPLTGCMTQF